MTPQQEATRQRLIAYIGREIEDEALNADPYVRALRARNDFAAACGADKTFAQRFYAEHGHDAKPELYA